MTSPRSILTLIALVAVALVAAGLAGCGGSESAPPPPPAPPPFVPQNVAVELGEHGGGVTLVSTQAGGWTLNGQPFTSGSNVTGQNGADYRLTFANGTWSAEFVPGEPVNVELGTSGTSVEIETLEDGTYRLGEDAVESGMLVTAANGNSYRLLFMTDGAWAAEFVPPEPEPVTLGVSGSEVLIDQREDGLFEIDGEQFESGDLVEAPNGNSYRVRLSPSGEWVAIFESPDPVLVQLGESGDEIEFQILEDGSFTLDGQPITSGDIRRIENGNEYEFIFERGQWRAEFVSPPGQRVVLGTSGNIVDIERLEDGSFTLDGQPITSGDIHRIENGNEYEFIFERGQWRAEFVSPPGQRVVLGTSGNIVDIERLEDGSFTLDGQPITGGDIRRIENGNVYAFIFERGQWRAEFVSRPGQRVVLGTSGNIVDIERLEDGEFRLDGEILRSGDERTFDGDVTYRFSLTSSGNWNAVFVPNIVRVELGDLGGVATLRQAEDGLYRIGTMIVRDGSVVEGGNRESYRLEFRRGEWEATFLPVSTTVPLSGGGSLVLLRGEDGSYERDGQPIESGDSVEVGDDVYVLTLTDGSWEAVRERGMTGVLDGGPDMLETYIGVRPLLTDASGRGTREGSVLSINDQEYDLSELFNLAPGDFIEREDSVVSGVRSEIESLLDNLRALVDLNEDGSLTTQIESRWDLVAEQLDVIFDDEGSDIIGDDVPTRRGELDGREAIATIEEVLEALGDFSAFEDALDRGIFADTDSLSTSEARDLFDASLGLDRIGFGWTDDTRFGAYSKRTRSRVGRSLDYPSGEDGIGAFAYSPLDDARTRDLPSRGEAYYDGDTIAASRDSDQEIYSGIIELLVRFTSGQVSATITDLLDSRGNVWEFGSDEVQSISLPNARIDASDGSFGVSSAASATIIYEPFAGSPRPETVDADFDGQFLGEGEDAGNSLIGVWSLDERGDVILTGAFGAELDSTGRPTPPTPMPEPDDGLNAETSLNAAPDSRGHIEIAALDSDGDRIELPAEELFSDGELIVSGDRLFDRAISELTRRRTVISVYGDIGDTDLSIRQAAWDLANEALEDNIFGRDGVDLLGANYPSGRNIGARDSQARQVLQDALDALSTQDDFEDSLDRGGVFSGVRLSDDEIDDLDFDDVFDAVEFKVEVHFGSTDYGRFGAWAKSERENALSDATDDVARDEEPDVFAYSPLEQTEFDSRDPNYPSNFMARYTGQTRAVDQTSDGPVFYDGDISLNVDWGNQPTGSPITAVIEGLARIDNGDLWEDDGREVDQIIIDDVTARLDSDDLVEFSKRSASVRLRFDNFRLEDEDFVGTRSIEGKFVGTTADGPLGVIGIWSLDDLRGAFGADLGP